MNDRDELLGAALLELEVPEHAPGFFTELRAMIAAEAEAAAEAPAPVVPIARRHRWQRPAMRVATVAAAVATVLVAAGVGLDEGSVRPRSATAAEVTARMRAAVAAVETLRGDVVFRGDEGGDVRYRFVSTARGDFRLTGITRPEDDFGYDAAAGVETGTGGARTGLALGPPDQGPFDFVLSRHVAATVRALSAAGDASVRETPGTWELDATVRPNVLNEESGDRLEVTVDKRTGLPVRIVESRAGVFVHETRLENLVVDQPVARSEFTVPAGPARTELGWRRGTLAEAEAAIGYRPPVPLTLPEGYELAQVAWAREAMATGAEGTNPETRMAVALAYRRGLDLLLVTTRLRGSGEWDDPLATGEGFVDAPEALTITGGRFAGAPAELLADPRGVPHVWALGEDLVLTVSGDATREELLAVAGSVS